MIDDLKPGTIFRYRYKVEPFSEKNHLCTYLYKTERSHQCFIHEENRETKFSLDYGKIEILYDFNQDLKDLLK